MSFERIRSSSRSRGARAVAAVALVAVAASGCVGARKEVIVPNRGIITSKEINNYEVCSDLGFDDDCSTLGSSKRTDYELEIASCFLKNNVTRVFASEEDLKRQAIAPDTFTMVRDGWATEESHDDGTTTSLSPDKEYICQAATTVPTKEIYDTIVVGQIWHRAS